MATTDEEWQRLTDEALEATFSAYWCASTTATFSASASRSAPGEWRCASASLRRRGAARGFASIRPSRAPTRAARRAASAAARHTPAYS